MSIRITFNCKVTCRHICKLFLCFVNIKYNENDSKRKWGNLKTPLDTSNILVHRTYVSIYSYINEQAIKISDSNQCIYMNNLFDRITLRKICKKSFYLQKIEFFSEFSRYLIIQKESQKQLMVKPNPIMPLSFPKIIEGVSPLHSRLPSLFQVFPPV